METDFEDEINALLQEQITVVKAPKRRSLFDRHTAMFLRTKSIQHINGDYYRFHMTGLTDGILFPVLEVIHMCELDRKEKAYKRIRIYDVLEDMGYTYMCEWITCHKNRTYTVNIPLIHIDKMIMLSNMLFPL